MPNKKPTKKTNSTKKKIIEEESDDEKMINTLEPNSDAESGSEDENDLKIKYEDNDQDFEDNFDDNIEIDDEDKEITPDKEDSEIEDKLDEEDDDQYELGVEDKCFYKYAKEDPEGDDDEDEDSEELEEEPQKKEKIIRDPNQRITKPVLFKYERVRLICDRAKQISLGAKVMIKNTKGLNARQIAELELKENVFPLIIRRQLPNGGKEEWKINELAH